MTLDEIRVQARLLQQVANGTYAITYPDNLAPIWRYIGDRWIHVDCKQGKLTVSLLQPGKVALASGKGILARQ